MKRNDDYFYSEICSFEDIRIEKSRLILRGRIIESRIKLDILQVRDKFSFSSLVLSMVRGSSAIPRLLNFIGNLLHKSG